jgi:hypothetical protein
MLSARLTALAAEGGNAVVSAAATTAWTTVKPRFARLFARGDDHRRIVMERRLENTRTRLDGVKAKELEPLGRRLAQSWTTRLEDLLEDHPDAAGELQQILGDLARQSPGAGSCDAL